MNIQQYISTGIVERYVLHLCDEKENNEFERVCGKYPEVDKAREAFEQRLEEFAMLHAIQPPKHLKSRIFAHIEIESEKKEGIRHHGGSISNVHPRINWLRYLAAAAIILLFVSTLLNFYFVKRLHTAQNKIDTLLQKTEQPQKEKLKGKNMNVSPGAIDTGITAIELKPVKGQRDQVTATIIRNDKWKDLMLLFHHRPPAASDRWYQLWAIVSGKPVAAGRFTVVDTNALIRLKNISADSFAITVNEHGLSNMPAPHQLYIAGNKKD